MNVVLLLGIVLLLILQAVEVWRRVREPDFLSARQFWRRLITAGIAEIVLVMWLIGEGLMSHQPPLARLAYWSASVLLLLSIPFLALRDMIDLMRTYHQQRAELFRSMPPDSGEAPASRSGDRVSE
jgi:hypothetical protein